MLRFIDLTSGLAQDICKIQDTRNLAFMDGLAITSDGKTAAITTRNTDKNAPGKNTVQIHLVHLEDGKRVPLNESPSGTGSRDLAFSPDGKFLMERYGNRQATLFDTESSAVLWSKTGGSFELYHFQATGTCRYISASRTYAQLAPQTGLDRGTMSKVPFSIPTFGFLCDSNANQILYHDYGIIRKFNMLDGQVLFENRLSIAIGQWRSVQISYVDGYNLTVSLSPTIDNEATLQVWDGAQGTLVKSIPIEIPGSNRGGWKLLAHSKWRHVAIMRGNTIKAWPIQNVREDLFVPMEGHISHGFAFGSAPDSFIYQKPRRSLQAEVAVFMSGEKDAQKTGLLEGIHNPISFFHPPVAANVWLSVPYPTFTLLARCASLETSKRHDCSPLATVRPFPGLPTALN